MASAIRPIGQHAQRLLIGVIGVGNMGAAMATRLLVSSVGGLYSGVCGAAASLLSTHPSAEPLASRAVATA